MPIKVEAAVDAAFQHIVNDEIERGKLGQIVSNDPYGTTYRKKLGHANRCDLLREIGIQGRIIGYEAGIEPVSLVACAAVSHFMQAHFDG